MNHLPLLSGVILSEADKVPYVCVNDYDGAPF